MCVGQAKGSKWWWGKGRPKGRKGVAAGRVGWGNVSSATGPHTGVSLPADNNGNGGQGGGGWSRPKAKGMVGRVVGKGSEAGGGGRVGRKVAGQVGNWEHRQGEAKVCVWW